jgi:DNA-binding transcriptional ArsR family regulator
LLTYDGPWGTPGRAEQGATDRLTYNAVVRTAIAANSMIVGMSRYTLAELAGVSPSTAYRSLNRHVTEARLARLAPESEELALRYEVLAVLQSDTKHSSSSLVTALSGIEMQQPPPDLFRAAGGLSKAALRVYEALDPTRPQTAAELARKLDRNPSSVGRILPKLFSAGLAQDLEDGWVRTDANLEDVAEDYGVNGAADRMRRYNAQQREAYRAFLKRKKEQA